MSEQVTLTIDGREISVPKGTLVIRAAERLGITIPRFCDHPLLAPVGACRQCMVEVEGQAKPFTSCTTQCTEGMVVKTHLTSEVARAAQEGQLEFLLINHPLDCPMCDKGGECPLQDQTLAHGPPDTRMIDDKRRYEKPILISAQIALDRERCVLCARCTRFSGEISGDPFIELFERGALEQVAIYEDEPYHSHFSGNVVQICPVGALTSTSYRFHARPFDVRSANSVCNQCSAGCNLRVDIRAGEVQRQLARDNMAVNEMWSCDKGRFGYAYVAHPDRLTVPRARDDFGAVAQTGWRRAVAQAAQRLRSVIDEHGPEAVGVLAGGKLTDEDAYAVSRFARDAVGTDNVDFRRAPRTDEERDVLAAIAGTTGPTYDDVENADVVVVAGLDPHEEVPILFLRLRKAWRRHRQRIVVVGPSMQGLEEIAWRWIRTPGGAEAQVLASLHGDDDAPTAGGDLVEVRDAVAGAERAVVLAGQRLAASPGALRAAARLADDAVQVAWVPRQTNARGAVDAGLVPGLLPGGRRLDDPGPIADVWHRLPAAEGMDTRQMLAAAAEGRIKALVLVGSDPVADAEDPALADRALAQVEHVIALDLLPTASNRYADVLLPACAPQERVGSFTTWEGRRQPFAQVVPPQGLCLEDWDVLRQIARALDADFGWETAADVRREAAPLFAPASGSESSTPALRTFERGPAVPRELVDDGWLDAIVVDQLIGDGTLLAGADELLATRAEPRVIVSERDADALGLADGTLVDVVGQGTVDAERSDADRSDADRSDADRSGDASDGPGSHGVRLRLARSAAVVPGCVVLPGGRLPNLPGGLRAADTAADAWLRVRLSPAEAPPSKSEHTEPAAASA